MSVLKLGDSGPTHRQPMLRLTFSAEMLGFERTYGTHCPSSESEWDATKDELFSWFDREVRQLLVQREEWRARDVAKRGVDRNAG